MAPTDRTKTQVLIKMIAESRRRRRFWENGIVDALHRRVTGKLKSTAEDELHRKFFSPARNVLSEKQEKQLADYIMQMDSSFCGLSINEIRRLVFEFAEQNKRDHTFNKEKKMAGRDFVHGFLKRQKTLSLRKPEAIALNRVFGLNKTSIQNYFKNLEELLETHKFEPHQIYNCDETGITCVHKPVKVIAPKGKRVVASVTSGERGQTTTIICAMSATGTFVPPLMIFKRKRMNPELIERAPPGTIGGVSDSGWVDTDLFFKRITVDKLGELFNEAYLKSATVENAVSGFKTTGIHPFNSGIIPDSEYLQDPREAASTEDPAATMEPTSGPSDQRLEATQNQHKATLVHPYNSWSIHTNDSSESLESFVITSAESTYDPELECSFEKILPVPRIVAKQGKKRSEESQIITSSPYKRSLQEAEKKSKQKQVKGGERKQTASKKSAEKQEKGKQKKKVSSDYKCLVCDGGWLESLPGEDWIQCSKCPVWYHENCCSLNSITDFKCDFCIA
eukprot:gene17231-18952_t